MFLSFLFLSKIIRLILAILPRPVVANSMMPHLRILIEIAAIYTAWVIFMMDRVTRDKEEAGDPFLYLSLVA